MEEKKVSIEFTKEELNVICRALDTWYWDSYYIDDEIDDKCAKLIERITNAF